MLARDPTTVHRRYTLVVSKYINRGHVRKFDIFNFRVHVTLRQYIKVTRAPRMLRYTEICSNVGIICIPRLCSYKNKILLHTFVKVTNAIEHNSNR